VALLPPSGAIGVPRLPIPQIYVRAALALIEAGGSTLRGLGVVNSSMLENHITYFLVEEMERAQRRGVSAALIIELRSNTKAHPTNPIIRGEIDIKFRWSQYPKPNDRYLAVEAKKLRGTKGTLADKYVTGGVADFVSGKYSREHDYGIMLGYVVVPPITKAITSVDRALRKRRSDTHERSPFVIDPSWCNNPLTYRSIHDQVGGTAPITLIHLFLDFC
jgi:hypothetical protein